MIGMKKVFKALKVLRKLFLVQMSLTISGINDTHIYTACSVLKNISHLKVTRQYDYKLEKYSLRVIASQMEFTSENIF